MPLSQKSGFKKNLVSFWRPNRVERRRGEEEEEEGDKFKQSSIKQDRIQQLNLL